ncbi:hypothetical protein HKD37_03G007963 [Glycine soja]
MQEFFSGLRGILFGLKLAWMRGYRKIRIDSDSQVAIKLVSQGCGIQHQLYNLIQAVHNHQGHITWRHLL